MFGHAIVCHNIVSPTYSSLGQRLRPVVCPEVHRIHLRTYPADADAVTADDRQPNDRKRSGYCTRPGGPVRLLESCNVAARHRYSAEHSNAAFYCVVDFGSVRPSRARRYSEGGSDTAVLYTSEGLRWFLHMLTDNASSYRRIVIARIRIAPSGLTATLNSRKRYTTKSGGRLCSASGTCSSGDNGRLYND